MASAASRYLHYHADYNTGTNTIYAGGEYESYLLLPVIPKIMSDAQRRRRQSLHSGPWDMLARADVLSGLLFIAIAAFGLWASRNYPVGTALRMGTGYMPRLLCWVLLGPRRGGSGARACGSRPRRCAPRRRRGARVFVRDARASSRSA